MPPVSTPRKSPERSRSAATMPEMPSGNADSPSNGTTAIGIAVPAPPTISIVSCARAGATSARTAARRERNERRSGNLIGVGVRGRGDAPAATSSPRAPER